MSNPKLYRAIGALEAREPEIGRALWALEEARRRTLKRLDGMDPALLDWESPESGNSIGTLLYHIAAIEIDYLYVDMLEQPFPQEIVDLLPYDVRDASERLTPVRGFDLAWHMQRLDTTRRHVLDALRPMDLADYRRVRSLDYADITPEWTLYHLTQHEAEHRGEIMELRSRGERAAASSTAI
jgi:uncharacterized damage-inducible protein DinB